MIIRLKWLFAAVAIAASTSGFALADDAVLTKTKVPFDFTIGNTRLPAGDYVIERTGAWSAVRISSWDTRTAVTVLLNPAGKNTTRFPYSLVFNRYGDRYFLRQIWVAGLQQGVQIPVSRAEREEIARHSPMKTILTASAAR